MFMSISSTSLGGGDAGGHGRAPQAAALRSAEVIHRSWARQPAGVDQACTRRRGVASRTRAHADLAVERAFAPVLPASVRHYFRVTSPTVHMPVAPVTQVYVMYTGRPDRRALVSSVSM
jgi:hypothetical protein